MAPKFLLEVRHRRDGLETFIQTKSKQQLYDTYSSFANVQRVDPPFFPNSSLQRFEPGIIQVSQPPVSSFLEANFEFVGRLEMFK